MTDCNRTIGTLTRRDIMALAGGAALAGLTGLPAFAEDAIKKGGVLKVAAPTNPSSLDPATGGSGADHSLLWTMYDTLIEWDYDTLKPKPGLAKWSYPDPKTMDLDIVEGIKSTTAPLSTPKRSSSISTATGRTSAPTSSGPHQRRVGGGHRPVAGDAEN